MKIKNRITILFTAVVTLILLLLCFSIYYISGINRQEQFRERLKNRNEINKHTDRQTEKSYEASQIF